MTRKARKIWAAYELLWMMPGQSPAWSAVRDYIRWLELLP